MGQADNVEAPINKSDGISHESSMPNETKEYDASTDDRPVTKPQLNRLFAIAKRWQSQELKHVMQKEFDIDSSLKLDRGMYQTLCDIVETMTICGMA